MRASYKVSLSNKERDQLNAITTKGKHPARTIIRARILLLADEGQVDEKIRKALNLGKWTPQSIRMKYCKEGLERALYDAPRTGQPKVTTKQEDAEIIALACSEPPDGSSKWTLDLLTTEINKKLSKKNKRIGRGTVYNILLRNDLKPWLKKNVVHSKNR